MINLRRGHQGQSVEHSNTHCPQSEDRARCRSCAHLRRDDETAERAVPAKQEKISEGFCISAYDGRRRRRAVTACDRIGR